MVIRTTIAKVTTGTRVHKAYRRDHNLRAAFVHVMADAAVSVLVIIGLVAGRQFGWIWMDPLMGLIATIVIMSWSWSLVRTAGAVSLDVSPDPPYRQKLLLGSNSVVIGFRTFTFGVSAPVILPLSFQ